MAHSCGGSCGHAHGPPARNPGLAPIALSTPAGSPWAGFDAAAFADHVCALLDGTAALREAYFVPGCPADAAELYAVAARYRRSLDLSRYLVVFLSPMAMVEKYRSDWKGRSPEEYEAARRTLAGFLPDGRAAPEEALPEATFHELALALHRRTYHHIRLALMEWADQERRKAWGLEELDMEGAPAWDALAWDRYERWKGAYWPLFYAAAQILNMLTTAAPVRRRVAQDIELLDRIAVGMLLMPEFYLFARFPRGPPPAFFPPRSRADLASRGLWEFVNFLPLLPNIFVVHPGPWRRHTRALLRAGRFAPGAFLCDAIGSFLRAPELDALPELHDEVHQMNHTLAMMRDGLRIGRREEMTDYERDWKDAARGLGAISDTCDKCGRVPEEGQKFKKCARCKAAWYCGPECQREAWKAWHKEVCVEVADGAGEGASAA